jgi:ribonuclease HI
VSYLAHPFIFIGRLIIMAKKAKFYVVWKGKKPGVYETWAECAAQTNGFSGAEFKAFESLQAASEAFTGQYIEYKGMATREVDKEHLAEVGEPILPSWSVDAACNPVPGKLEYRGVNTATKEILFEQGPFEDGTNNVGEFLAIVHALAECKKRHLNCPIYSDSYNAILWVEQKRCKTNMKQTESNEKLFKLIERAERWLKDNNYDNPVLKWETRAWGENPADYGRK